MSLYCYNLFVVGVAKDVYTHVCVMFFRVAV